MENKKEIVEKLEVLVKATRFGSNIEQIKLVKNERGEFLMVERQNCEPTMINVTADSGAAMIIDFSKWLDKVL